MIDVSINLNIGYRFLYLIGDESFLGNVAWRIALEFFFF